MILGSGSGVMNLPLYPRWRSMGIRVSARSQASSSACGGWARISAASSTIGTPVPGIHAPIFPLEEISQAQLRYFPIPV